MLGQRRVEHLVAPHPLLLQAAQAHRVKVRVLVHFHAEAGVLGANRIPRVTVGAGKTERGGEGRGEKVPTSVALSTTSWNLLMRALGVLVLSSFFSQEYIYVYIVKPAQATGDF